VHKREDLRTGQDELARPFAILVNRTLDIGQQFRRVLNLVNDQRRRMGCQEEARIFNRAGAYVRLI